MTLPSLKLLLSIGIIIMLQDISFKDIQKNKRRVKEAYLEKEGTVKNYFESLGKPYDGFQIFLRAFKIDRELEVWIKEKNGARFEKLVTYDFCATSGEPGPKRREGDLQIPEGLYHVNHFNPESNFHLSLGVSYPNGSDKILSDPNRPGGSIYIHGNCVTIGCIPITDDKIKELYIMCVEARNNGQQKIPIHIFPTRLDPNGMKQLEENYPAADVNAFWKNLKPIFEDFEQNKTLKPYKINSQGEYYFTN